jgi:hypothetical protein
MFSHLFKHSQSLPFIPLFFILRFNRLFDHRILFFCSFYDFDPEKTLLSNAFISKISIINIRLSSPFYSFCSSFHLILGWMMIFPQHFSLGFGTLINLKLNSIWIVGNFFVIAPFDAENKAKILALVFHMKRPIISKEKWACSQN